MVEWIHSDGRVPYPEALAFMEARVAAISAGEADEAIWLLEHPPLYTAGTSARIEDLVEPDRFPVYEAGRGTLLREKKIGGDRSGSGDAFAAIVAASLVQGASLTDAVKKAADFISKCLAYAVALDLPWNYGLPFEEYLTELR